MPLMGLNITDATCDYGLAQTAEGCARVLATYDPSMYLHFQIAYCVVGSATLIMSAVMYYRADKHDGSPLQLSTFLFCCYAALTMIVRGADPSSYGHIIPRPVGAFLSDSCTAALYSVYVIALGYWATIIQRGAAVIHKPAHLKCLEYAAIAFIWGFYIAYDMSLFAFKGFIPPTLNYIQLGVSASVLALIALTFLIYGLRVMTRLQEYERQLKLRMPSFESDYNLSNHSFDLNVSDSEDEAPERRVAPRRPKAGHTAKIRRILLVAEAVSIVVIAGQVYMVTQVSYSPVELACANGMSCSTVRPKWSLLHAFQVVAVWAILYVFRDVQKKSVIPHPRGSTGY